MNYLRSFVVTIRFKRDKRRIIKSFGVTDIVCNEGFEIIEYGTFSISILILKSTFLIISMFWHSLLKTTNVV